jgi:hypothetical protein
VSITAQAAVGAYGGADPVGEVGFSGLVRHDQYVTLGNDGYGTWERILFADDVTRIDVSARSYDAWVAGSAVAYQWA